MAVESMIGGSSTSGLGRRRGGGGARRHTGCGRSPSCVARQYRGRCLKPHRLLQACLPGAVQAYMQGSRVSPQDHGCGAAEDDPPPAVRPLEDGSGSVTSRRSDHSRSRWGTGRPISVADRRQVHQQPREEMTRSPRRPPGLLPRPARGDIGVDQPVHERHVQTFRTPRRLQAAGLASTEHPFVVRDQHPIR